MSEQRERPPPASRRRLATAHAALLDRQATVFLERIQGVVCDTTRAQMLRALRATSLNVTELTLVLSCSKWTASRHLRVLRESGLVQADRHGRQVAYRVADGPVIDAALATLDAVEATATVP